MGKPIINVIIILIGTLLASWMGTTGAAMLLIRPLIRANKDRKYKVHTIVFFIFLVANVGGSLTPLGDPPWDILHGGWGILRQGSTWRDYTWRDSFPRIS